MNHRRTQRKSQPDRPRARFARWWVPLCATVASWFGITLADEPTLKEKPITAEDRQHWAFVSPRRPATPDVVDAAWVRNPIDRFVLAKFEAAGVSHAPEADRTTLLRRLSFDLIGLPPRPDELAAFVGDPSPNAYEKVVERLLADPHYGERWAQHWLDLARYADSDGFEFDQARPDAWRYRDWVVAALNRDLPYDEFVRRQLAGDEIAPDDPDSFIATGFNRCYPDMVDLNDQDLRRQNALNDITETTGLVFLGLTIGCARCHDHKYDPVRLSDFYRLQAFFTPARFRDDYPIASAQERGRFETQVRSWREQVAEAQAKVIEIEVPIRQVLAPGLPPGLSDDTAAAFSKSPRERTAAEIRLVFEALTRDRRIKSQAIRERLERPLAAEHDHWIRRVENLQKNAPAPLPQARGLDETGPTAPPTFLLRRGEFTAKGAEMSPGFPAVLSTATPQITPTRRTTGRRTALAAWLTSPDHPLTARVIVNRLWQHHFGTGIVASPSDFGIVGEEPTNPELLDWLATELVASGWSLKAMHRHIVTSAAYRQSSRRQPVGQPGSSLAGLPTRRRLEGEAIRDAMLAVSGLLNAALGGSCVFPELPAELTKLSSKGAVWPVSNSADDRRRRSLYVFIRRNLRYPFFEAFDRPDANASCARRAVTTIAPQALGLLNGTLPGECARALAERVSRAAGENADDRIAAAYRLALGRDPDPRECTLGREFLAHSTLADFCLALLNINEFVYID